MLHLGCAFDLIHVIVVCLIDLLFQVPFVQLPGFAIFSLHEGFVIELGAKLRDGSAVLFAPGIHCFAFPSIFSVTF
jgi:hypothetical protein